MIAVKSANCSAAGIMVPILAPAKVPTAPNKPKTQTIGMFTAPRHQCCREETKAVAPTIPKLIAIAGLGSMSSKYIRAGIVTIDPPLPSSPSNNPVHAPARIVRIDTRENPF